VGKSYGVRVLAVFVLVAAGALLAPATTRAQIGMDKDPLGKVGHDPDEGHKVYGDKEAARKASTAEPYGGQIFCPVSGKKLGLEQPAVAVQTTIGEEKPSRLGKLLGQKTKPGMVIYACCPACAETIRRDPQTYLTQVIGDRASFVFKYANAPPQRPVLAPINYNIIRREEPEEPAASLPDTPRP